VELFKKGWNSLKKEFPSNFLILILILIFSKKKRIKV